MLIPCKACQSEIAAAARTCPKCGNPNSWTHPEIIRLKESANTISIPRLRYQYTNTTVTFMRQERSLWKPHRNLGRGLGLLSALFVLDLINWSAFNPSFIYLQLLMEVFSWGLTAYCFVGFIIWMFNTRDHLVADKMMTIDFDSEPPTVETNAPEFFDPVTKFFHLKKGEEKAA